MPATSTEPSVLEPDNEPSAAGDPGLGEEPPDDAPVEDNEEDPDDDEPVEPFEPVVSANATADIDAIAAPTPRATASAPTRPT